MKISEPRSEHHEIAVISGASSGIGLACARILSARGIRVIGLARDETKLKAAMNHLPTPGVGICCDVVDPIASEGLINQIVKDYGRIDWLITSAGIVEPGLFLDQPLSAHRAQMETNYFGSLNLARPVAQIMAKQGRGRIIFIASAASFVGIAGFGSYAPSKFAIRALAEIMQVELDQYSISVSVACPPDTDTPQLAYEVARRPAITNQIAKIGAVLSADHVAARIIRQAEAGKFMIAPTPLMALFAVIHSLYAPFFRQKQKRLIRRSD